jgi:hypothetical protein
LPERLNPWVRALYGIATATPGPNWVATARNMVDILIAGMARR